MIKASTSGFNFTPEDIDSISMVGKIGAQHAAAALSKLVGTTVKLSRLEAMTLSVGKVPDRVGGMGTPVMGVLIPFQGDVTGNTLLLFSDEAVDELLVLLFPDRKTIEGDLRDSAIAETGNILAGAIHTMLSRLTGRILISLPPVAVLDMAGALLDSLLAEAGSRGDAVVCLEFQLTDGDGKNLVKTVLLPGLEGLELMKEAAKRLETD